MQTTSRALEQRRWNQGASRTGASPCRRALLFALVVAAAAIPRLYRLDRMEFKLDEARLHQLAVEIQDGRIPVAGITNSQGVNNPPMAAYIFAVSSLLSRDPLAMVLTSVLFGSIAVGVTFLLGERYFGVWVGMAAALLLAGGPWAVLLSRKIWAQDLLALFGVFIVYAILRAEEGGRWPAYVVPGAIVAAIQVHYSTIVLAPLAGLAVLRGFHRGPRIDWLVGCAIGGLLCVPFAIFLGRVGLLEYLRDISESPRRLSLPANFARGARHIFDVGDWGGIEYVFGREMGEFFDAPGPPPWTRWLQAPLVLLGGYAAVRVRPTVAPWLGMWVGFALMGFGLGAKLPHPHYFASTQPCVCLLAALSLRAPDAGGLRHWPLVKPLFGAALGVLIAANFVQTSRLYSKMGTVLEGDFGVAYRESASAAERLAAWRRKAPMIRVEFAPTDKAWAVSYLVGRLGVPTPITSTPSPGALVAFCLPAVDPELRKLPAIDRIRSAEGTLEIALCRASDVFGPPRGPKK